MPRGESVRSFTGRVLVAVNSVSQWLVDENVVTPVFPQERWFSIW